MPSRLTRRRLIDILGDTDIAERLMQAWAGRTIPKPPPSEIIERNARIRQRLDDKESVRQIARDEGVSPSTVVQIGAGHRGERKCA